MTTTTTKKVKSGRLVDLTGEVCPMTFVKAKLHMERTTPGDSIVFVLKAGEQMRSVVCSLKEEGHRIEEVKREADRFRLLVRKAA